MSRVAIRTESRAAAVLAGLLVAASLLDSFGVAKQAMRVLPMVALLVVLLQPRWRRVTRRIPVALTLFLGWALASYAWSADPGASQRRLLDAVLIVIGGWSCGSALDFTQLHRIVTRLVKLVIVACYAALLLLPGWSTTPPPEDPAPGWHTVFGHKNGLGQFAVLALVTLWFDGSRRRRAWMVAAFVLMLGSQSSTALGLVLLLAAAAMWRVSLTALRRPSARLGYLVSSWALIGAGVIVMFTDFSLIPSLLGRGSTLSGRTGIWSSVLHAIGNRPLIGYGYGGVWDSPVPPSSEIWKELRFHAFHAHSGYLDLVLQTGLVGLVLFLAAVFAAIHRASRRGGVHGQWAVVLLVIACLNAVVESAPFFGGGLLLVAIFATASLQDPDGTPALRSDSSRSRYAPGAVKRTAATSA